MHPRVAMRILRHSKIAITMELYTMVPDEATLAALKRLSDALGSADAALPDDAEQVPVAVLPGQVFEKRVELRGLEPLAFWMQTIFFAYFYVAQCRLTSRLPAEIVANGRWASPEVGLEVGLRWLFVLALWGRPSGSAAELVVLKVRHS